MDKKKLESSLLAAVEEYLEATEAWDDAVVTVNPATTEVALMESEESDALPDDIDVWPVMDLIEMTPAGDWIPSLAPVLSEY